jgi:hypothetical protein
MAILQIGRAFDGLDVDVSSARWSGSQLSLAGDLYLGAVTAANRKGTAAAVRDRLLALIASRDEPTVPVVWSEDSSIDGWYRPLAASVDYTPASLNDGYAAWACDLELIDGLPQVEVLTTFGVINNDESITNATLVASGSNGLFTGIPSAAIDWFGGNITRQNQTGATRTADSGTVRILYGGITTLPATVVQSFTVEPADYYDGACSITGTYAGVASQLCLGRNMGPTTGLVLSNGLVRAQLSSGALQVQVYDSGTWRTVGPGTFTISAISSFGVGYTWTWDSASQIVVLRNAPEQCTVRLIGTNASVGGFDAGRVWLDLTVQRGGRSVICTMRADNTGRVTVAPSSNTLADALTGGLRQRTNDANGNRYVLAGANGFWGNDLTVGSIAQSDDPGTAGNQYYSYATFAVGCELDGSSASGINSAQSVAYELFAGRSETQRIVRR